MAKAAEPVPAESAGPFPSLAALRRRHAELLRSLPAEELEEAHLGEVTEFLRRGAASGAVLDLPAEREAAQGLLDFWKATIYTQKRRHQQQQPAAGDGTEKARLPAVVLAEFDGRALEEVAAAAEQRLRALGQEDPGLEGVVRDVLLRLVRLPEEGLEPAPAAPRRAELLCGDDHRQVQRVLDALLQAGAVTMTPGHGVGDEQVRLRYEALLRLWPRLDALLKKRVLFRDAALFWEKHGYDQGALFTGRLLEEEEHYRDQNALERRFVEACRAEERRLADKHRREVRLWKFLTAMICALSVLVIGLFGAAVYFYYRSEEFEKAQARERIQLGEEKRDALAALGIAHSRAAQTLMRLLLAPGADKGGRHVVKKILLIQTLGRAAFADTKGARDAARDSWGLLEDHLKKEGGWFFEDFLRGHQDQIARITRTDDPAPRKRGALLKISLDLREAIKKYNEEGYLPPLRAMRPHWFGQAEEAAGRLTAAAGAGRRLDDVSLYAGLFWRLYCGELVLVEEEDVSKAMVSFGKALEAWEASPDGKASPAVQIQLNSALGELRGAIARERKPGATPS